MKYLFLLVSILTLKANAQQNLRFDKRFVECEDKWVAFKMNEDSSYTFGFIYIDEQAGLTFNREGNFKWGVDNLLQVERLKEANIKVRLQPNNVKVALIPETMFEELQIDKLPEWLSYYKTDTASVKRLYNWGYMYNGWNECAKALTYLTKAKEIDPTFEGLNVELAFSYNCLKDFEKAEKILEEELVLNPTNAYVNKEYIYTISKTDHIEKATTQYLKSLETIKDKSYNAENCFNIMQFYYNNNDLKNFNIWYKKLAKCDNENKLITEYAEKMKNELNK